jgi:hypothetical protein
VALYARFLVPAKSPSEIKNIMTTMALELLVSGKPYCRYALNAENVMNSWGSLRIAGICNSNGGFLRARLIITRRLQDVGLFMAKGVRVAC